MSNDNIYNSIQIVIALNLINNNFKTKILCLFKIGNKIINKIQQILYSAKAKNLNKQATNITKNLAILFKNSQ